MASAYDSLVESPWVEFMPGREDQYSLGIVGPRNALSRLNTLSGGGRTEQASAAVQQIGSQRYGVFGAPWGNVPEALDRHLREVIGVDPAMLGDLAAAVEAGEDIGPLYSEEKRDEYYETAEDSGPSAPAGSSSTPGTAGYVGGDFSGGRMDPSGGGAGMDVGTGTGQEPAQEMASGTKVLVPKTGRTYSGKMEKLAAKAMEGERDEGIRLVEVRPGIFEWQGWENDPEYRAYIEGLGAQRSQAARGRMAAAPQQMAGPMMKSSGAYSQLEQLYATQDPRAPTRPGQTPATKPGAVVYPDTPGYIGQQAAEGGPQRRTQKTALDQFFESYGYDG